MNSSSSLALFYLRKQLTFLRDCKGNGTSMITLILPPNESISKTTKMLVDEYGTASNIKSRVNRLSVLSAITSAQQKLKQFKNVPENGLAIFSGTILINMKEKKVSIALQPHKPINTSLYMCDSSFHVQPLLEQFKDTLTYGFIIMDGTNTLFATLNSSNKNILHQLAVSLPKKHGRGGQSSVRFARIRVEKRNAYVKKVAELSGNLFSSFLTGKSDENLAGLVLAGTADFKNNLFEHPSFPKSLKEKVIKIVDTNYGGENGLNQAIQLAQDALSMCKYVKEREVLQEYFDALQNDMVCYGVKKTLEALRDGGISKIIVIDTLSKEIDLEEEGLTEFIPERINNGEENDEENVENEDFMGHTDTNRVDLLDWLVQNASGLNAELHIVSDKSTESEQFKQGFEGIGGIMKYQIYEDEGFSEVESDEIF